LTGYNSELSDRPFAKKKNMPGGFDDSPIRLNANLRNVDQWNENEIVNRAVFLAEKAKTIWEAPHLSDEVLDKYRKVKDRAGAEYSLEIHDHLTGEMLDLFNTLRRRILNIDSSVREEIKKLYIAYKSSTNFVDIIPQKTKLKLSLNIEFSEIVDERAWCKDVAGLGRWGNGDVEVSIDAASDLDYSMDLILQAFEAQIENA
jgi:predicted transport protein